MTTEPAQPPAPATPTRLGVGNVTISLAGQDYILKPTLNAVQMLSAKYGGLNSVIERIVKIDFMTIIDVILLGLGPSYNNNRQRQRISELVYAEGLDDSSGGIAASCVSFVGNLMRGGRPPKAEEEHDEAPFEGNP